MTTKTTLRTELLAARRAVNPAARRRAADAVARHVAATRWLAPGKRIGIYAALKHELDTTPLIALAFARGCQVYVPRITSVRARALRFVPWSERGRRHAFGMHEPEGQASIGARFLDTLFVPVVGVDRAGARLGFGAGFYDRALAFRRVRAHWRGPRLAALAYHFQVVPHIPATATDVSMDCIVTDGGIDELLAHEDGTGDVRDR